MQAIKTNKKIKRFWQLNKLAEEFAKVGIKEQYPNITADTLRQKLIEKRNLNNLEEQWERKKLSKTLLKS